MDKLEATVAGLVAMMNEQAAQIQNVSAQLEAIKPAPQVVNNPQSRTTPQQKQQHFTISRRASLQGGLCFARLTLTIL